MTETGRTLKPWRYVASGAYAGCILGFSLASFPWLDPYVSLFGVLGALLILLALFAALHSQASDEGKASDV